MQKTRCRDCSRLVRLRTTKKNTAPWHRGMRDRKWCISSPNFRPATGRYLELKEKERLDLAELKRRMRAVDVTVELLTGEHPVEHHDA